VIRTRTRTRAPRTLQLAGLAAAVVVVAPILAACSTPRISTVGDQAAAPSPSASMTPIGVGVDLAPLHVPAFIFGSPTSTPMVQPESAALVHDAGSHRRLQVRALPSGPGTAAIDFLETALAGHPWGDVMLPVERTVFKTFARQRSLGNYLVMLTDVDVQKGPDPIPITAYRWSRADVEAYARCGIPDLGFNPCTDAFFLKGNSRIISTINLYRGV
jgi:hypothetical protein